MPTTALVTGGTSGIGKAIAKGLARSGVKVVLLVRSKERGAAAAADIHAAVPGASVDLVQGDLASLRSVRRAAAEVAKRHKGLDLLVQSAGVFLPDRTVTEDGIEATFAANHLGHFLLTNLLLPTLKANAPARIVTVASRYGRTAIDFDDLNFEKRKFSYLKAVPPSKLAQVLFTQELADRLAGTGVVANAIHPGLVSKTHLLKGTGGFLRWVTDTVGKTPEVGADTALWLATATEAANETGGLWAKRKRLKTPGQGSDPAARRRLWEESERLAGIERVVTA
ncbi:MAG: SDR family NAD(P)-dependent oxidoreductase [Thermoplasmatota archaeon]